MGTCSRQCSGTLGCSVDEQWDDGTHQDYSYQRVQAGPPEMFFQYLLVKR